MVAGPGAGRDRRAGAASPCRRHAARPAGQVFLTLPLATLLGLSDRPGVAAGHGPLPGDVARALATAAIRTPRPAGA